MIYLTGQRRKVTKQTCLDMYLGRFLGPDSFILLPGCRALCCIFDIFTASLLCGVRGVVLALFALPALFAALFCDVRGKNENATATHAWPICHDRRARQPGPPDERPDDRPDERPDERPGERGSDPCSLRPR